jgi:cell division control protein 45
MLLEKENWRLGYHQILSDCLPSTHNATGGTVLILANPDVDALCAARILSYALRADKVPYQLRPCGGFNCLLRILRKLGLNKNDGAEQTIRAVLLLNLGATRNLEKALFQPVTEVTDADNEQTSITSPLLDRKQTKLYVLDSHRPYHLANIYAPKNIVLWNDFNWHDAEGGGVPSDGEYVDDESSDSEEDENESDDDDDSDDDDIESDAEKEAEFEEENDASDTEVSTNSLSPKTSDVGSRKKARLDSDIPEIQNSDGEAEHNVQVLSMREQHKARRDKVRKYYSSGAFYSSPVAFMAYTLLADQLRHDSVGDLLWLACIGVTDSFIHDRLDLSGYATLALDLQEKVEKVYPDLNHDDRMTERLANIFHAEELYENNHYNGPLTQVGFSENGRILYQRDEFRFFLLRHTSLWEAMILSPDLNTKMELWKSSGIKRLKEMLAKMGLPLAQCQQPYAFMIPSLKRRLKDMMIEHEEVSYCD